ncbi:hypothetical protein GWK47_030706 [Chionoecetes opilio]|uniref:Uncharacterized protein n=1 Tax=Chionoecetes opilio TaxID=41210 RepID=A0A8J4YLE6_CHIOP|nr:hypothetical protein GWK47_030706 [Chionoecetes opilio]
MGNYHFLAQDPWADTRSPSAGGKNFLFLHINAICRLWAKEKSTALPVFHSFTGLIDFFFFWEKGEKSRFGKQGVPIPKYRSLKPFLNIQDKHRGLQEFQMLENFSQSLI